MSCLYYETVFAGQMFPLLVRICSDVIVDVGSMSCVTEKAVCLKSMISKVNGMQTKKATNVVTKTCHNQVP